MNSCTRVLPELHILDVKRSALCIPHVLRGGRRGERIIHRCLWTLWSPADLGSDIFRSIATFITSLIVSVSFSDACRSHGSLNVVVVVIKAGHINAVVSSVLKRHWATSAYVMKPIITVSSVVGVCVLEREAVLGCFSHCYLMAATQCSVLFPHVSLERPENMWASASALRHTFLDMWLVKRKQ